MARLRELRGPETRERDLANILGFEHSRAVRWKEGQMYVDRAEYLLRLADALELDPMMLIKMAAGITVKVTKAAATVAEGEPSIVCVGQGPGPEVSNRRIGGVVRETEILENILGVDTIWSPNVAQALVDAERLRPELFVFGVTGAGTIAYDACAAASHLSGRSGKKCRVAVVVESFDDASERLFLSAGATKVVLAPISKQFWEAEIEHITARFAKKR